MVYVYNLILDYIDYKVKSMIVSSFIKPFREMNDLQKKNVIFIMLVSFVVLFSYSMIRSTVDALFLDLVGAKKSPLIWLYSVLFLTIAVGIYNKLQTRIKIQTLFLATSVFTFILFACGSLLIDHAPVVWSYTLSILKEVYIILLVHMGVGLLNESVDYQVAKFLYGPVGAINGLAGMFGGMATSWLTYAFSTEQILLLGSFVLLSSSVLFWQTSHIELKFSPDKKSESPLKAIRPVACYVFWIVMIVALSQICISLANFKFNLLFEQMVPEKMLKTRYLGTINTAISALNLTVQLILVPLSLRFFRSRTLQFAIPVAYGLFAIWGFGLASYALIPVAATFVFFKGIDYSIFSVLKELLYFPLKTVQKYGAKYIVDMVVYRFAKGMISFVLIFYQSMLFIDVALGVSLIMWIISLIFMFKEQQKIFGGQL